MSSSHLGLLGGEDSVASLPKRSGKNPNDGSKVGYWIECLDLTTIIHGFARGNELYQARRLQSSLMKSDPHCFELVRLDSHLKKCAKAVKLTASKIASVPGSERHEALAEMAAEGVEWPLEVQVLLVSLQLKEEVGAAVDEAMIPEQCAKLKQLLSPWTASRDEHTDFDVLLPMLWPHCL